MNIQYWFIRGELNLMFKTEIIATRLYIHYQDRKSICIINNIQDQDFRIFFPLPLDFDIAKILIDCLHQIKQDYPLSLTEIEKRIKSI